MIELIHIAHAAEETASEAQKAGILDLFGLDLKLFIAQLVNFGIVLLVLWKWVFTPVTKGLQKRTKTIEDSLKNAEKIEEEKKTFEEWKTAEMSKVRQEAVTIVNQAKNEAENAKNKIMDEAKEERERIVKQTATQLENEKAKAIADIKGQLAEMVVNASEKIIKTKLDNSKDQQLIKDSLSSIEK